MKFQDYTKVEEEYNVGQGAGEFMKLKEGDNIIRVLTEFELRGVHQFKLGNKFQTHVCVGRDKGCVYCKEGSKVSVKYLGWVIDKKDNKVKLLEIGHTIFKQIGELQKDEDYAFESIPDYNLKIKRSGEGLDTKYQVVASPKKVELTDEEKSQVMELKPVSEIIKTMKEKELKQVPKEELPTIQEDEMNISEIPF